MGVQYCKLKDMNVFIRKICITNLNVFSKRVRVQNSEMQTKRKIHFNDNLKSKNILIPILFVLKIFNLRFGNFDVLDT